MEDVVRIVTFDGGGIRGALTARLLEILQNEVDFLSNTHVFSGTSTGSLIALGLAYGMTPTHLSQLYHHFGAGAFQKFEHGKDPFSSPLYDKTPLKELLLASVFKTNPKLSDLKSHVIVPSFRLHDIGLGRWCPYVFHNLTVDPVCHDHVIDVALASSAAPIFFSSHQGFIDGGIYANNPSMVALTEWIKYKKSPFSKIRLLSFGTGSSPDHIDELELHWGAKQWMMRDDQTKPKYPFFSLLTEGTYDVYHNQCEILLGEQYKRVNLDYNEHIAMDDVQKIGLCFQYAEEFPKKSPRQFHEIKTWIRDVFLD